MNVQFPDGEMGRWACLGTVTDRSVRVWLRDSEADSHLATLHIDGDQRGSVELQPCDDHDSIAVCDIVMDMPAPCAEFEVRVAGMVRKGKLSPEKNMRAELAFGFGSCHQPFTEPRNGELGKTGVAGIYGHMARVLTRADARFLMLLGDQVYSDEISDISIKRLDKYIKASTTDRSVALKDHYRRLYRGYFNEAGFRNLLESFPSYMMWDDHDITNDWGSFKEEELYNQVLFESAKTVFREYQGSHNPGGSLDSSTPFCFQFWHGDTGLFILDLRSERNFLEERLLGDEQWEQFTGFLDNANSAGVSTLFIGSTIPVIHFSPAAVRLFAKLPRWAYGADVRERWDAEPFHDERNRLLDLLFDWQAGQQQRQVFILSGDVHVGTVFEVERRNGAGRLYQVTSSALTSPGSLLHKWVNSTGTRISNAGEDLCLSRRLGIVTSNNFGLIEVAPCPDGPGHDVTAGLHGYDSKPGKVLRVRMSPGRRAEVL